MAIFSENLVLVQVVGTIAILITGTIGASAAPILDAIHKYHKRKKDTSEQHRNLAPNGNNSIAECNAGNNDERQKDGDTSVIPERNEVISQNYVPLTAFDYYMPLVTLILKTLGTGVVLATALMHVLPDGLGKLEIGHLGSTEPHGLYVNTTEICGSDRCYVVFHGNDDVVIPYPYGMLFASIAVLLTFILEVEMHSLVSKARDATMVVYMTEVGMVVHSLLIGIAFAVNTDVHSLNALVIALCVHQLCEGCAMGPLIQAGARNTLHAIFLILLYSASVPVGVVIGAIVKNNGGYSRGRSALLVEGILNSFAGGLLIYISTVEFLAELMTLLTGHGDAHGHGGHVHKFEAATVEEIRIQIANLCPNTDNDGRENNNGEVVPLLKSVRSSHIDMLSSELNAVISAGDYTKKHPIITRVISHFSLLFGFSSMAVVAIWA